MTAEDKRPELKECPFCGSQKVTLIHTDYEGEKVAFCDTCYTHGPQPDNNGHKWNSIPRRSEVAELFRLVDEALSRTDYLSTDWHKYNKHADKMRKEWGI